MVQVFWTNELKYRPLGFIIFLNKKNWIFERLFRVKIFSILKIFWKFGGNVNQKGLWSFQIFADLNAVVAMEDSEDLFIFKHLGYFECLKSCTILDIYSI